MGWVLPDIVRANAARWPHGEALACEDTRLTWEQLDQRSSRVANALIAEGLRPGERVAVLARNNAEFFEVAFGTAKAGGITVSLNWRLAAIELAELLADAAPTVLIIEDEFAELVAGSTSEEVRTVRYGEQYETWIDAVSSEDPAVPVNGGDTAYLLYTSGTTGRAKGIEITHANLHLSERMAREGFCMDPSSVHMCPGPQFHIAGAGTGLMAMFVGGRTVIMREATPELLLRTIEREGVTHAFMVPAIIQAVLAAPELQKRDVSSLKQISYGAAPMTESMLTRAIEALGCDFLGVYGMTEAAGTVVVLRPEDHEPSGPRARLLGSVGKPLPWMQLYIADPATGDRREVGQVGEIVLRGGQVTPGYWRQPDITKQSIDSDGWFRTGDGGYLDADGYLFLKDRIKDMIISGGENVYPAEVENALAYHPDVADVSVIGIPHDRWGETVRAIVVAREGTPSDESEIVEFACTRLAKYKCPTSVVFVDALPRNPSGKVLKQILRQQYGT
jgi:long-chain acyl-CoA synthetase